MELPSVPPRYDAGDQTRLREELVRADGENFKKDRDVFVTSGQRLLIQDASDGSWRRLQVAGGVLTLSAATP